MYLSGEEYWQGCFCMCVSLPCCQVRVQQVRPLVRSGPRCCLNPAGCDLGLRRDEACSELHTNTTGNKHNQSLISISRTCLQCKPVCVYVGTHLCAQTYPALTAGMALGVLLGRKVLLLHLLHPVVFRSASQSTGSHCHPAPYVQKNKANMSRGKPNLLYTKQIRKCNRMHRMPN